LQQRGDCNAGFFPALSVTISQPLQFTAQAGSALQTKTVQVNNKSGGLMSWTASIGTMTGSGWLTINPTAGVNGGTVLVNVFPQRLTPGTYTASLIVDAGPQVGNQTLPISVTVTAASPRRFHLQLLPCRRRLFRLLSRWCCRAW